MNELRTPKEGEITIIREDVAEDNVNSGYSSNMVALNEEALSSETETQFPEDLSLNRHLEQRWKKPTGSNFVLVQEMLERGLTPSQILQSLIGSEHKVPSDISESMALRLLIRFVGERGFRHRLPQYHDFAHAVELFKSSKNILVLSGAGISVSCGIPDFRSSRGIYATLKQTFPDLPHPTAMFDIGYFKAKPQPFYSFAKELFPGTYNPSVSHFFIKFLELEKKLLRNYTQNIDTLERLAGITRYVECHGSFGSATCLQCGWKYTSDDIREAVYAQEVARCRKCGDGLIKPDIVFFGEDLPDHFHLQLVSDREGVDLLVVIGSSLQVQPVSLIPYNIDEAVPQILINKEDISSYNADIKLIGDCDEIIITLAMAMGGNVKELMLEELKSRSSPVLTQLEPLLEENFFPKAIIEKDIKERIDEENATTKIEDDDIPTKRAKFDEENEQGTRVDRPEDKLDLLRGLYGEAKFISVPSKLAPFSYAKFQANLNVFKGADFYYNTEQDSFGALPRRQMDAEEDFDDGQSASSSSSSTDEKYCRSNPEFQSRGFETTNMHARSESCPPFDESSSSASSSPSSV